MAEELAAEIAKLTDSLPANVARALAEELRTWHGQSWALRRVRALDAVAQARFHQPVECLLDTWQSVCPDVLPESVALALACASMVKQTATRGSETIDLVWTGPSAGAISMRRTDQALLEVIHAADAALLIVSFAVYRTAAVSEAILDACARGVTVRICLEADDSGLSHMGRDASQVLGSQILEQTEVYVWPKDRRPRAPDGGTGVLHAKCAVADKSVLFVSSANLTDHALSVNMELGVLIRNGPLPAKVARHFQHLVATGTLRRL